MTTTPAPDTPPWFPSRTPPEAVRRAQAAVADGGPPARPAAAPPLPISLETVRLRDRVRTLEAEARMQRDRQRVLNQAVLDASCENRILLDRALNAEREARVLRWQRDHPWQWRWRRVVGRVRR